MDLAGRERPVDILVNNAGTIRRAPAAEHTAEELGKSVVAAGVFHSGLLSRDRSIAKVCAAHGTTLPAAAVAFPYSHPSIINVTLGMRTAEQVLRNVELRRQHIPEGLWDDLRARGLIRSDVPAANGPGRSARCL